MRYGSICSGIEAATVAWHGLGWEPAFFSEIDNFPRAALQHHYPNVPLHGDFTTINGDEYGHVDLLVGGTPCQDFSIAGLRAGFAGERGNLTLEFARLVDRMRPRWVVWENVPGVLSIDGGRAFGAFLGALAEIGYGFAYRILDAQYCGVPQRRRRVFVVGYLGDWRRAAAVLFERESLLGHPAPRRQAGERVARPITPGSSGGSGYRNDADTADNLIPEVCPTLVANGNKTGGIRPPGTDGDTVTSLIVMASGQSNAPVFENDQCPARTCLHEAPIIAHTLRGNGHDASEDGTGRGVPLVPVPIDLRQASRGEKITNNRAHGSGGAPGHGIGNAGDPAFTVSERGQAIAQPIMAGGPVGGNQGGDFIVEPVPFDTTQITSPSNYSNPKAGDPCHPLAAGAHPPAVAFDLRGREGGAQFEGPHDTANIRAASGGSSRSYVAQAAAFMENQRAELRVSDQTDALTRGGGKPGRGYAAALLSTMQVRRLTPRECERLQGFPDDYTLVPYRGKPAADGNRYKALGNSMAVPVMRWIGERIELIEALTKRIV